MPENDTTTMSEDDTTPMPETDSGRTNETVRVADGVYALPVTFEIEEQDRELTINPAAVETERGLILVDVTFPPEIDQLEAHLDGLGYDLDDVWAVLLTHQDPDHVSALSELADRIDPVVFAHPECAPYVDGRAHPVKMEDSRYPPARVDVELSGGDRFSTAAGPMEVVFTPGHAPGHVSLYFEDETVLVSGDALHAPDGTLDGPRYPLNEATAIDSVGTLAEYDAERTLTYHHGVVDHDADAIERIWTDTRK
jgi:glyoxylase-like metal-dependent hydrolase (beta-lactamase superfamily II)